MIWNKIKLFFRSKENKILFLLFLALSIVSLFFVLSRRPDFINLSIKHITSYVFFAYFILTVFVLGTIAFFSEKFNPQKTIQKILWVYSIAEIILLCGAKGVTCFVTNSACLFLNNIIPFATVLYLILLGSWIIKIRKNTSTVSSENFFLWFKKQGRLVVLLLLFIFGLNLGFGYYHLAKKAAVDEALWTFDRIPKFWNNILDGEWQKTNISDKPGITVALISGIGMLWEKNPKEYKDLAWQEDGKKNVLSLNFALRFPVLLFSALMLFVFYYFVEKLLGKKIASLSIILIGLSPILLGISTIINPDSLLWIFVPLSMLSYFVYKKEGVNAYLYWAGIFLGFSLLTKYIANILYVFFFLLIFLEYIFNEKRVEPISTYLKKAFSDYFIFIFFSLLTFLVLLPAAWTETSLLLESTILSEAFQKVWPVFIFILFFISIDIGFAKGKATSLFLNFFSRYKKLIFYLIFIIFFISAAIAFLNTYFGMPWFDFESILASPKSSYQSTDLFGLFLANFFSLIFGISPFAFLALIFLFIKNIRKKISFGNEEKISAFLIIFILLYYFASAINSVSATVRYQIIIYPIALLLAAIGMKQLLDLKQVKKILPFFLAIPLLLVASIFSLVFIKPFYLSYASNLLPQQYVLNLKDMGDGSYEAAQYLNNLPNAKNLLVWTDKRGVCTFFVGNCIDGVDSVKDGFKNGLEINYFIISSGRESRTSRMTLSRINGGNDQIIRIDKLYQVEGSDLEWKLTIGKRSNNFVKIIKTEKIISNNH